MSDTSALSDTRIVTGPNLPNMIPHTILTLNKYFLCNNVHDGIMTIRKTKNSNGILKLVFIGISFLIETGILLLLFASGINRYYEAIITISRLLAFLLVIGIYSQNRTGSIKTPWIILILILPAVGVSLYILIGLSGSTGRMRKRYEAIDKIISPYLEQDSLTLASLEKEHLSCAGISKYLIRESGYPVYKNTKVEYYSDASEGLKAQKEAIRNAKSIIFIEYFAIENASSWQSLEEILEEKAKEGVEVRVFYDDIGSVGYINHDFVKRLESKGIRCRVFNPMVFIINMFLDNRDHRKMTIVDGKIGFTGGYNIADEYFNITSPYGHWKDTGVRIEGEAVLPMTLTFLEMWNAVRADDEGDENIARFFPEYPPDPAVHGYVQFYADNPIDKKPVGEDVYINMISRARKYIYIMTPYLIITDEMNRVLGLAAKRGVDVRLITPGIPDKKIVYKLTRSYYNGLARNGVRIFEYTPGFCHAKMCVSDDIIAICGTINLDYRSLYHHFEDGCLLIGNEAVLDMKHDFDVTFSQCLEVTEKYTTGRSAILRLSQLILRLFAPLI